MKIKITLERPAGEVDLVLTADADATVGDVADALAARDPERAEPVPNGNTLALTGADRVILDPGLALADSGIKPGARIAVGPA
jgi:S-DNA-T family DNA segregation ATPase FtsK/SpoIIIE